MTELEQYIQTYFGVPQKDLEIISTLFKPTALKKGAYFLKTGGLCNRLGFLQAGLIREYVDIQGKEVTKWISTQGYFVVDLAGFVFGQPARWNIQALTDCELFVIDNKDYRDIKKYVEKWETLEKLFMAKCFMMLEERVLQHLALSAEERYHQLFSTRKDLFNQVPLQYLASMLGMTPETLSRLRKKASVTNS